jgi:hypothetical protein
MAAGDALRRAVDLLMSKYLRFVADCHLATLLELLAFGLAASWTVRAAAAEVERPADAIEVFHCAFDEPWDVNFDEWPDRWVRKSDGDHPNYVDIRMGKAKDADATGGRCLEIDLDGASAAVSSPPIRVMSRFSYLLTTRLHVSGLKYSRVTVSIDFFDAAGERLQTEQRSLKSPTDGWHTLTIESIDPHDESIDRAVISLDVERGARGDLQGKVRLDDVWLARLPRITVSTNSPYNVYQDKADVVVRCELSGIRERNPEIRFQLLDASSNELHGGSVHLNGRLIEEDTKKASEIVDGIGNSPKGEAYEGVTEWRPKIRRHGFYSVVVTMLSSDDSGQQTEDERKMDRRVIWLAVVPRLEMPPKGDFGWTLPDGDQPLSFQQLAGLLPNVGINWVKVPAWYDVTMPRRGDDIIRFVEMLGASNIEVVGVIDGPPAGSEIAQRLGRNAMIADLLSFDPTVWLPALDPVMSRLSMRLRYWQIGADGDMSFVGFPSLGKRISEVRDRLFRFGQQVTLGVPWVWDGATPAPADATWEYEQLTPDPALTLEQFEAFVSKPPPARVMRWVTIEPPPRPDDPTQVNSAELNARATQFVRKIVAAKEHGIEGIFISRPFNDKVGLMRANGMPGELLLPWRTSAAMLSGSSYLGSIQLPGGSENRNFLRPDGKVVMVVWNETPTQEVLFLGHGVEQIDVWGGAKSPAEEDHQQVIEVGPVPTFVLGLSEPVLRWRMALRFEHDHVESIFAKPHPNAIQFQNFFAQGVGGTISIVPQTKEEHLERDDKTAEGRSLASDRWSIEPPDGTFNLGIREKKSFPFEVRLKNAIFGEQPMRVDFVVDAEEQYRFSVYRTMWVGTGDVTIDIKTHLDKEGMLIVEQMMTNNSNRPVDFKCNLFAKGHRRQRSQVYRLGPTIDRKVYRYPNGAELVGKELTLEAEEIGGERVLKYRFVATKDKPPEKTQEPEDESKPKPVNNATVQTEIPSTAAAAGQL